MTRAYNLTVEILTVDCQYNAMAPDPHGKYTASELAQLAGVSERTVRYYIREALIDAPTGRGRGSHFGDRHLNQLRRVRYLQATGLDLDSIRQRFAEAHRRITETGEAADDSRIERSWPPEMISLGAKPGQFFPWARSQVDPVRTSAVTVLEVAPGLSLHVAAPHRVPGPMQLAAIAGVIRSVFNVSHEEDDDDGEDGNSD
jgi:hypothetical protein